MMKSKLLAAAMISMTLTGAAKATPITYAVSEFFQTANRTVNQSVAGSITTDGTLGLLGPSNIIDWNLVSTQFTTVFNPPGGVSSVTQFFDYLGPLSRGSNPPNSVLTAVDNIIATPLTLAVSNTGTANFQINAADQFGPLFAAVQFQTSISSGGPPVPSWSICVDNPQGCGTTVLPFDPFGVFADGKAVPAAVPGPVVGAGLPGLILACGVLLALARHRRQIV
jgi:hypothetical protein